jgi:hypothetical protein
MHAMHGRLLDALVLTLLDALLIGSWDALLMPVFAD